MKQQDGLSLKFALLALVAIGSGFGMNTTAGTSIAAQAPVVRAVANDDTEAELDQGALDEETHSHVEEFMKARFEQMEYQANLQRASDNGESTEVAIEPCKYISGIGSPPPLNKVALTFDDGPNAKNTPIVLDVLKKYKIKATFFMLGKNVLGNEKLIKRVLREGHSVANHSLSHPNFHSITPDQQAQQVVQTNAVLTKYMGSRALFRYPYGNSTCETNHLVKNKLKYKGIVGWHIDTCDWAFAEQGSLRDNQLAMCEAKPQNQANYAGHVIDTVDAHGGGIILMHDIHSRTALSLEEIIVRLQRKGYKFTTLDTPDMQKFMR